MQEEMQNAYNILIGKPESKRQLGTHRNRWEDNIKIDFGEKVWEGADFIPLTLDRDWWWTLV
jgi:hypothetical protein